MRTLSMGILLVSAGIAFGLGDIIGTQNVYDKFLFTPFTWLQVIGAGLLYVLYSFVTLIKA